MLTLALETSTARYGLALGEGGRVLFDSAMLGEAAGRDLGELLLTGLARAGAQIADIGAIAVDIGPGSLGSLRDGVAFANGLAYARGLPVYAYTAFELMGVAADAKASRPALCVRRANEGLAYAGTFDGSRHAHAPWRAGDHRAGRGGRCGGSGRCGQSACGGGGPPWV
jgi:tRNA threonylcarbamoyladenosine biosynthesis protein TsaB